LCRCICGIGERSEKIEDGAQAKFAASGLHVLHSGVHGRGEEKRDADFLEAGGDARNRDVESDAESFDNVGGSALRSHAAVAMLGDADSGAGDYESGGGGNVEGAAGVAAGAAGVDEGVALGAADIESVILIQRQRRCGGADGLREADNLLHGFAFHAKRDEKGADLGVGGLAAQNRFHDGAGFLAGEVLPMRDEFMEDVGEHGTTS